MIVLGVFCEVIWAPCSGCCKPIVVGQSGRSTCSPGCREQMLSRAGYEDRVCAFTGCGRTFSALKRVRQQYCTDLCCARAYIARNGGKTLSGRRRRYVSDVAAREAAVKRKHPRATQRRVSRVGIPRLATTPTPPSPARRIEPPAKHVPMNTHRKGELAFALLYGQGATGRRHFTSHPPALEAKPTYGR